MSWARQPRSLALTRYFLLSYPSLLFVCLFVLNRPLRRNTVVICASHGCPRPEPTGEGCLTCTACVKSLSGRG